MSLVGLDIGTTGCKAIIFGEDGRVLGQSSREYGVSQPHPGWAEQDAELVYTLTIESLRDAMSFVNADTANTDHPVALAISCQGEAVIPVDTDGRALRPAILGMDTRTTSENEFLSRTFGAEYLFERTGVPVHTINTLPKLLWIQRNEPEIWDAAEAFLLYEDFFLKKIGGQAVISRCLASRTQMTDIANGEWATDVLRECGIDPSRLATLGPLEGGVVGKLNAEVARQVGISHEVALVCGGHDQACAALGSGVTEPGLAMVSTGTAEVVEVAMEEPTLSPALRQANLSMYRHVVPGLFLTMTLNHSGGMTLRWFRDTFGERELAEALASDRDAYDLLLEGAPDGPTPLMALPHFSGSGTPWLDTKSKGAILGMTFSTDKPTVAKALLEGLTFELRVNLDLLHEAGVDIRTLNTVGGGARSHLWLQLKADICNIPIQRPMVTEAACLGAALAAGVGASVYPNFNDAVANVVKMQSKIEPRPEMITAYKERFELYQKLYPLLADYLHRL